MFNDAMAEEGGQKGQYYCPRGGEILNMVNRGAHVMMC